MKVDLRIQGIPQDAVPEDQGRMTKIRGMVGKLQSECQNLSKKGKIIRFSEES